MKLASLTCVVLGVAILLSKLHESYGVYLEQNDIAVFQDAKAGSNGEILIVIRPSKVQEFRKFLDIEGNRSIRIHGKAR